MILFWLVIIPVAAGVAAWAAGRLKGAWPRWISLAALGLDLAPVAARAGVADRVHFTGALEDVRPLYAAADCFMLPTRYDPFPNAALEALAAGVPASWLDAGAVGVTGLPTYYGTLDLRLHRDGHLTRHPQEIVRVPDVRRTRLIDPVDRLIRQRDTERRQVIL